MKIKVLFFISLYFIAGNVYAYSKINNLESNVKLIKKVNETNKNSIVKNIVNEYNNDNTNDNHVIEKDEILPKLTELIIKNYDIQFQSDIKEYNLEVDSSVESIEILAKSDKETNSIWISENCKKLIEGKNEIVIEIKDENNLMNEYKLFVTRKKKLSNNNYLASIIIGNYEFNFDPSINNYNLNIQKEKTLNINVVTENEHAKYEIIGNNNLKDGSIIKIKVTAENGSTRDYKINIIKKFNILNYIKYIVIAFLVLLLILLIVISRKRKKINSQTIKSVDNLISTAGSVNNNFLNNKSDNNSTAEINKKIPNEKVQLRIIEPTNIETNKNEKIETNDEQSLEIFKL